MTDKQISAGRAVATVAWGVALALVFLGWWWQEGFTVGVGVAFATVAATATVRQFFVSQNEMLRNAFEVGRDVGRVRDIR